MKPLLKDVPQWGSWRSGLEVAQPRTTNKMSGVHTAPDMDAPPVRVGADNHKQYPSLRGRVRYYLDGRIEPK